MAVLITGASGFVGSKLLERLESDGVPLRCIFRSLNSGKSCANGISIGNLSEETDWTSAIRNVEQVIHLAARVHVMNDKSLNPLEEFRRINCDSTANLARQAAAAGVRRFIFLSSIKVNGEFTEMGRPFTPDDKPAPADPYGISKYEAEKVLCQIASETNMEVVIIRSPLVYGPGVKANFKSMMRLLAMRIPLPFACLTDNRRSLVALDNLVDLIVMCLTHPLAANQIFLVSDDNDLSTVDLLRSLGKVMGHPARLFYVPPQFLRLASAMLNQTGTYQRLCGSLQLDISKTRRLLNWTPPLSVNEGFRRAAQRFSL